jgi:predicted DNA-binding protein
MAKITKMVHTRVTPELLARINHQAGVEQRNQADFIRRVLERYIEDKEFESGTAVKDAAAASMEKNAELLKKLEDS